MGTEPPAPPPDAASARQSGSAPADSPTAPAPGAPSAALVRALRRVLRPLVRLMLARGITYPYLGDLLKALFVEVAERDFRLDDKSPSDSRVSLVSGVHRKDVSRLRQRARAPEAAAPAVVTLGAHLVARWMGHPLYQTDDGQPRPLARLAREGGERSFEALVASVNSDIRSRVVLDEWLRLGVVRLDADGCVRLNAAAFVPTRGADEKAHYLGLNLADHASAAVHNVLDGSPALLERSVHYTALPPAAVQRLARLSERLGMKALLAVNQAAMEAETPPVDEPALEPPRQRITFGVYFYAEPMAGTEAATPPSEPTP